MAELILISTLNGVLFGMLLFLMASGLTLIFSMMGVLNFAHASFYMLGAFFGFQISRWAGFWPALILAPILVGRRRHAGRALRPAQRAQARTRAPSCCSPSASRSSSRRWCRWSGARRPVDFRVPALLDFPAFTVFATNYPAYKLFMLLISIGIFVGLFAVLTRTRIGLIVQAALTHPHMVAHLGHNVPLVFMTVFGFGAGLAAIAGVIAGPGAGDAGEHGGVARADPVRRGRGGRPRLAVGRVRRVAADRAAADICGFGQSVAGRHFRVSQLHAGSAARRSPISGSVTVAQIAPIMPYILLVLVLIFKPTGLIGTRDT